jgi:glycosyltransferase involved in cell wall biosynthesis
VLTLVMATYNGAQTLPQVLTAYTKLEAPAGGWRLVIVDNGSTDATPEVIEGHARQLPLTSLVEPAPGKNAALNTALAAVEGDLVVFTDDDIVPEPGWLCRLRHAADTHPDFQVFGGRIVPRWPQVPAAWILAGVPLGPAFGVSPPLQSGPVSPSFVYGGNMAVRAELFAQGFRFDASIGPRRGQYPQGGELQLTRRFTAAGHQAWYCQDAVVEHVIRPHQLTEPWVLQRARRYGRGTFRLRQGHTPPPWPRRLARTARLSISLARQTVRVLRASAGDDQGRIAALWTWNTMLGQCREAAADLLGGGRGR